MSRLVKKSVSKLYLWENRKHCSTAYEVANCIIMENRIELVSINYFEYVKPEDFLSPLSENLVCLWIFLGKIHLIPK